MKTLQEKIQQTSLFSEEEKKEILSKLSELNEDAKDELEETIDDYTGSMISLFDKYKASVEPKIEELKKKEDLSEEDRAFIETVSKNIDTVKQSINKNK